MSAYNDYRYICLQTDTIFSVYKPFFLRIIQVRVARTGWHSLRGFSFVTMPFRLIDNKLVPAADALVKAFPGSGQGFAVLSRDELLLTASTLPGDGTPQMVLFNQDTGTTVGWGKHEPLAPLRLFVTLRLAVARRDSSLFVTDGRSKVRKFDRHGNCMLDFGSEEMNPT